MSVQDYRPAVAAREGLRVITVGHRAELRDPSNELSLAEGGFLLIRPDGYVGATFGSTGCHCVNDYLARCFPVPMPGRVRKF